MAGLFELRIRESSVLVNPLRLGKSLKHAGIIHSELHFRDSQPMQKSLRPRITLGGPLGLEAREGCEHLGA